MQEKVQATRPGRTETAITGAISPGAEAPRDSYHRGNVARDALTLAVAMVEQQGAAHLSMREIGKQMNLSAAALYRHYADRQALLDAVAAHAFTLLNEAFASALEGGAGPAGVTVRTEEEEAGQRLARLGQAYVAFALEHPQLYRLLFGPRPPRDGASRGQASRGGVSKVGRQEKRQENGEQAEACPAALAALGVLQKAVGACFPAQESLPEGSQPEDGTGSGAGSSPGLAGAVVAAWALVHGYIMLRLDGHLDVFPDGALPPPDAILGHLFSRPA